jgi:pathogen-inducible salicylic acid glucosyltransferase
LVREKKKQKKMRKSHVLVIPYPAQGHINPMIQFSKRLASKGLQVTAVIFSSQALLKHTQLGSVGVVTIDCQSHEEAKISIDDYLKQFQATVTLKLRELVAELKNSSGYPICCLVYDSLMPWVLETARQLGFSAASFFTQSCAVDTVYYHIHEGQLKIPLEKLPLTFSRPPALEITDLPSFVQGLESKSEYSSLLNLVVSQFSNFREADWIFVNTFNTLEEEVPLMISSIYEVHVLI